VEEPIDRIDVVERRGPRPIAGWNAHASSSW
jgi:hypothetical protein